jgi:rhodanese-related sulfurtransferase
MIPQIQPTELAAWLAQAPATVQPIVLDVREPHELQTASVNASVFASAIGNGFELVAIPMGTVPARLAELDATRPIACLCHHGARSQRVALFLAENGFANVVNLAGGIDAWSRQIDPSVARY